MQLHVGLDARQNDTAKHRGGRSWRSIRGGRGKEFVHRTSQQPNAVGREKVRYSWHYIGIAGLQTILGHRIKIGGTVANNIVILILDVIEVALQNRVTDKIGELQVDIYQVRVRWE